MLRWAAAFFIIAIIAAIFGFGGIATGAVDIAKVLFVFFLIACAALLVWGLFTGRRPPLPPI